MNTFLYRSLLSLFFSLFSFLAFAQQAGEMRITNYLLKESLIKNDKLAIVACDSLENPNEDINGTFQFTINGFNYSLNFHGGVAIAPNKIERSTFVFMKHTNDIGTFSTLYYVLKRGHDLQIFTISWFVLLIIPFALIVLVMLFKRFLWIAIILLILYLYLNYQNGLNIGDFLETTIEGMKNVIS